LPLKNKELKWAKHSYKTTCKDFLLQEIDSLPATYLPDVIQFVEFLKVKPPVTVKETSNTAAIPADGCRNIQETLYLLSIPGMRESLQEGLQTPLSECEENCW
jgi:hypothetical protein